MSECRDLKKMSGCDKEPVGCVGVISGFSVSTMNYSLLFSM